MDFKTIAVKELKGSVRMLTQDLEALPEEAFDRSLGGKARTVADMIYEITLVNDHIGMIMRGEKPFDWPEGDWILAPADFRTKETVLAAFRKSSDSIVETVESFSDDEFTEVLKIEDGETTRYQRCSFMTRHMWYHSGQINFIQTLLGDDRWHWN